METAPEILYHYTTQEGLIGILDSGSIWASSIAHLNDSSEFKHSLDLVRTLTSISSRPRGLLAVISQEDKLDYFLNKIIKDSIYQSEYPNKYVTSFSRLDNDLSQWRAYSSNGVGYCIGINTESFLNQGNSLEFRKVKYDDVLKYRSINSILSIIKMEFSDRCLKEIGLLKGESTNTDFERLIQSIDLTTNEILPLISNIKKRAYKLIEEIAVVMKDKAFAKEEEWRLITEQDQFKTVTPTGAARRLAIKFRPGKSFIIPYIEIPILNSKSIIEVIYIGPSPNMHEAKLSVETLIKSKLGSTNIDIKHSDIPYRTW